MLRSQYRIFCKQNSVQGYKKNPNEQAQFNYLVLDVQNTCIKVYIQVKRNDINQSDQSAKN